MQTLFTVWRILLLAGLLVFPQVLGVLLYYRLRRAPRWLAFIAAALAPAILFFFLSPIYFFAGVREAYAREGCSMPAVAATILVFAGTIMELGGGLFAQIVLATRRRRKVAVSKGEK